MPNWCDTTVTVRGPEEEIEAFKRACLFLDPKDDNNGIDFQRVIPMPEALKDTEKSGTVDYGLIVVGHYDAEAEKMLDYPWVKEAGVTDVAGLRELLVKKSPECVELARRHLAVKQATGYLNWYDWSCANWLTKWPPVESRYWVEDGCHKLHLATAWSPPIPVFQKIVRMFPKLSFVDFDITEEQGYYFVSLRPGPPG
jgi:hypothetical protein